MSEAPKEIWCSMGLYYDYKKELEAENKRLRLEAAHANDTADAAIDRIAELEAKLAKVKTSFRRNMIQAYPNYTYKQFAKDFDEMLKGDKP
jgi:DNA repair exonuclease SbcCD ATPase subunit